MIRFFCRLSLLLLSTEAFSQTVAGPVFDAASVKPVVNRRFVFGIEGGPGTQSPTRIHASETHPLTLLLEALGVPSYQIVDTDRVPDKFYEIDAVFPEGTTKAEYRTMLLNLLIERFHLRFHRETRNLPLYELRVADGGHKLKESGTTPVVPEGRIRPKAGDDGYLTFPPGVNTPLWGNGPRFSLQRVATTMDEFAESLIKDWYKQPVVNETGLTGKYDIYLRFNAANADPANVRADDPASGEPPFLPALKEQLGLVIRETKGPVEVVVIDSIASTPNAN